MRNVIIIDLDGTLCDDRHRDHLAVAGEWEEFHSRLSDDVPHPDVVSLLQMASWAHQAADDEDSEPYIEVIAITGRNEKWRDKTVDWLVKHCIHHIVDHLLMRGDDDFRPIGEVKIALMEAYFAKLADPKATTPEEIKQRVMFVIDDRDKAVEAYRAYGLPCWQVRPGGY